MAQLELPEAMNRLQANEANLDTFVNGGENESYTTPSGAVVPSIQNFMAEKAAEIDAATSHLDDLELPNGSAMVGHTDSGIGGTQMTVASALNAFDQKRTGGHFVQSGAKIQRLNDRVLIGAATINDARYPNDTKDWLSVFQTDAGLSNGSIVSATSAALNDSNEQSAQTFIAGAQSLNFTSQFTSCIGSSAYAVNNNASHATKAWAFYGEAHKVNSTSSAVYGMELDTRTLVESITPNSYQQGDVIGLQIASGCELAAGPQFDASAAIQIQNNPKKFKVGINFGSQALTSNNLAITLAQGHKIQWSRASGFPTAEITSSSTTQSIALDFGTDALFFKTMGGSTLATFDTNGKFTIGPPSTTARTISAIGSANNTNSTGSANNPQLFIKNTSGAALGEKAEVNFSISSQDYASASVSAQYSVFNASGDVGADLVFATRKSTADGGLKERARIDNSGNLLVTTAGTGLRVKEGANAKQGIATLIGGTVVVSNTSVTSSSRIQLTGQDNNVAGALRVSARSAGTSFTITSNNASDSGVVAYFITEPA